MPPACPVGFPVLVVAPGSRLGKGTGGLVGSGQPPPAQRELGQNACIEFPSWAAVVFGCLVPSPPACGHLPRGSIGTPFAWCPIQLPALWHRGACAMGLGEVVPLGGWGAPRY